MSYAKRHSIPPLGVTSKGDATSGRSDDILLQILDVAETRADTKAPNTSTPLVIALGAPLTVVLLESCGFRADHFKVFDPVGKFATMICKSADVMNGSSELPVMTMGTPFMEPVTTMSAKGLAFALTSSDAVVAGLVTDSDFCRHLNAGRTAVVIDNATILGTRTADPGSLGADVLRILNERLIAQITRKSVGFIRMHDLGRTGLA